MNEIYLVAFVAMVTSLGVFSFVTALLLHQALAVESEPEYMPFKPKRIGSLYVLNIAVVMAAVVVAIRPIISPAQGNILLLLVVVLVWAAMAIINMCMLVHLRSFYLVVFMDESSGVCDRVRLMHGVGMTVVSLSLTLISMLSLSATTVF